MRILYGVQATGNGHITRARSMAPELRAANIEVDYVFSGRPPEQFFNMECFGAYHCLPGLTFATAQGRIDYLRTAVGNNIVRLWRDIAALDLTPYDLVITDFEPVSAWAARRQGKPCIGIGHQYAFRYAIPTAESNPLARAILNHFAPANISLGLHWHHFEQPILPPMIEPITATSPCQPNKILVYLPFEDLAGIRDFLQAIHGYEFYVYHHVSHPVDDGHLHLRPFSRQGFLDDLATCSGVISNAGFELLSEALQLGRKILVKPLQGQMEQASNARALQQLGYGEAMQQLDSQHLSRWLAQSNPPPQRYPNVARAIVEWLRNGMTDDARTLSRRLWSQAA